MYVYIVGVGERVVVYKTWYGRGVLECVLQVNGRRCYWRRDGTYLGVVAVVRKKQ